MDWKQLQELYKSHASYGWLPNSQQIPKGLGEPLSKDHLNSLKLDNTLHNTYEYLQRVAVGFDQIVKEERNLKSDFEEVETYVLSILCEIENTMIERKLQKKPDIQRNIMPDNLKNGDNTAMNLRNYMILRDYINILEYVIACFEHLKTKA